MKKEIWKPIEGYEGFYEISNFGRVKSLSRYVKHHCGGLLLTKEKIFSTKRNNSRYYIVSLHKNSEWKKVYVHRLVAQAFIGKSNLYVNHIDGNGLNNNVNNLEWVSQRDNIIHGYKSRKKTSKYTGVSQSKGSKKWRASLVVNKKLIFSYHNTETEAANKYQEYIKLYFRNQ